MANHLTPDEISKAYGIERKEVIRVCLEEHVPIYHGKIDRTLFEAVCAEHEGVLVAAGAT
jgi:hypothetical protein